jgi:arylsulfatase
MDGTSLIYSFDKADAPNQKQRQYYEMSGNRAIWVDGWKAVTLHAHHVAPDKAGLALLTPF